MMKIRKLVIHDFRGFNDFTVNGLGRVNLLVGTNNSGKSTILEAINILLAVGDASAIWATLARRGEEFWDEQERGSVPRRQVEIQRLFRGHELKVGGHFELSAETDEGDVGLIATIEESRPTQPTLFDVDPTSQELSEEFLPSLALTLSWSPGLLRPVVLPIGFKGGISLNSIRRIPRFASDVRFALRFVSASSLNADVIAKLFEGIVLTPEEELVTRAMRIIEPDIERIASSGGDRVSYNSRYSGRGGMFVKLKGVKNRVPIGSMGDGIWRMLGLALSVVQSAGGILLVDEIDTGLHHTVMKDMWQFLYSCAKEFDVQIVATTHSRDCFRSLAVICRENVSEDSDVTIHRIERDREETVAYSEQEIVAAADLDMEVR